MKTLRKLTAVILLDEIPENGRADSEWLRTLWNNEVEILESSCKKKTSTSGQSGLTKKYQT